ncbi:aminopeptidase [Candidatus Enterococcus ferrettii]|uniref:Aminopeptidase n=1 Tax=Candidatus Enterococcus ferrettii TaxID=2815324 RepID=A0ABV0EWJ3_9ENTE|nr:aminopeptidase [Enterococcus sp. 665A]MBO1342752.1 aminopeptidase [Enterococcus sp. 665A]
MVLPNFLDNLKKYARLIAEVGINTQQGETVVVYASVDQAPLARLVTTHAYQLGAAQVIVQWNDDFIQREFLMNAAEDHLLTIPEYKKAEAEDYAKKRVSRVSIVSSDPDALLGVDTNRVATYQQSRGKALKSVMQATQANKLRWTVVAAASPAWAEKVFPKLDTSEEQLDALWDEIFKTTRIYNDDPIKAWRKHDNNMRAQAEKLNKEQFSALHYTAPGTDLLIGLPENHIWEGAGSFAADGNEFMANMPTEEVFTAPDRNRVDGYITSTKPLSYAGTTLLDMKFTFKDGQVVDFSAREGQEVLASLLDIDEGAKHLGEVALVPDPSPISQSGITFYNTLFDENASNHLALGAAYPFSVEGGTEMSEEELTQAGLNNSQTHVDFMVGSNKMSIDGIREDGSRVPVFRDGDWAQ